MMSRIFVRVLLLFSVFSTPVSNVLASSIGFSAIPLGGDRWRYDYTVTNAGPPIDFDQFTLYFDKSLFAGLSDEVAAPGWSPFVAQPDLGLASDGFLDVLSLAGLAAAAVPVSGFSVSFTYLGAGAPGSQPFDLLDSSSFVVVQSGFTTPVPEPAAAAMLILGLPFVLALGRRRARFAV